MNFMKRIGHAISTQPIFFLDRVPWIGLGGLDGTEKWHMAKKGDKTGGDSNYQQKYGTNETSSPGRGASVPA